MRLKKRIISAAVVCAVIAGLVTIPAEAENTQPEMINVLSPSNAKFTIVNSDGVNDGKDALDRNIVTMATTKNYNGIPIYDINGGDGTDYIMLMTVATKMPVPIEKIKMNYEFAMPLAGGRWYSNGESEYMGKPVTPWPEGVEIFVSGSGEVGSWQKAAEFDTLEGKLLKEKRSETLWDDTDGIRTYYSLPLDRKVTARYLRIAIRDVKPWLGQMNIPEIELLANRSDIPAGYSEIILDKPENSEIKISGDDIIGFEYGKHGSNVELTVSTDDVSEISSVMVNGTAIEEKDGKYIFAMPDNDAKIKVESVIKAEEKTPLILEAANVTGGEVIPNGTVPVITLCFNHGIDTVNKDMVTVNGIENSGLIQHAFVDATDAKKVYIVPFSDKLRSSEEYTVELKDTVKSRVGTALSGKAAVSFVTAKDYGAQSARGGYILGYGDGTFRPENGITMSEALTVAERLGAGKDFSMFESSERAAKRIDIIGIIYVLKNGGTAATPDDAVAQLVGSGIIRGYGNGDYGLENNVTRAEAVALFNRAIGVSADEKSEERVDCGFTDVPAEHWAAREIFTASQPDKTKYSWNQNLQPVTYDVNNEKNSIWEQIPCVTQEMRDMGMSGGEGGQWMQAIEIDNVDGQLLFGGVDIAGMVRSVDGGKSWQRSYKGFSADGCVDIAIDPNSKKRVVAVGSLSDRSWAGLYLSEDMGDTWHQVHSYIFDGQRDTRQQLAWDKSSYDEKIGGSRVAYWSNLYKLQASLESVTVEDVFRYSDREGGLFKTEDGGETWFCVNKDMSDSVVAVHPLNGRVYVGNERGFFISDDGGKSFKQVLSGRPIYGIDVVESRPDNVYINDYEGVMISMDCGKTFTRPDNIGFPVRSDVSDVRNIVRDLEVSPADPDYMMVDDRNYTKFNNRRYYTHDGGKTWNESGYDDSRDFFFNHSRQHPYAWHPTDKNRVWTLGGDWIVSSTNGGESFIWDANGYCGTPPGGRLNFDQYEPRRLLASAQDLLGIYTKDGGYTWEPVEDPGGGGFGCSYGSVTLDDNTFVIGKAAGWYAQRSIWVSFDGGKTLNDTGLVLKNGGARRATSFWRSPSDADTVFAGEYVSRDRARTWTEMDGCEMVMAINYYHNKELWGLNKEMIVCSYDNGTTWYPFSKTYVDDEMVVNKVGNEWSDGDGSHTWDMEYDGINDILYYLPGNVYMGADLIRVENNQHINIGQNIQVSDKNNSKYYGLIALDPRYPDVLYLAGGGLLNKDSAAIQRSCDRGETFQIIGSMGDEKSIVNDGPTAGSGAETIVVNPVNGDLWMWSCAEGLWKFPAPYENK